MEGSDRRSDSVRTRTTLAEVIPFPTTNEKSPGDVIYIYDGKRSWKTDRRYTLLHVTIAVAIALVVGIIIGHILALVYGHAILAKTSVFYKEAIMRGDAAMAMLAHAATELESFGSGKNRVVLADDLRKLKQQVTGASRGVIVQKE
jgi:hypothetical protein